MERTRAVAHYPRRRWLRRIMQWLIRVGLDTITHLEIVGQENIPREGPLMVVANHFNFLDPLALIRITPWPLEFVGGANMPNAPATVTWIPKLWGFFPAYRGAASREALRDSEEVLAQKGMLGIFPEAGSWAQVLRPARPGAAFLAVRTGAPLLPVGIDGMVDVFARLRQGRRARVVLRIGKPFGPFTAAGHGRERRHQLESIGREIMQHIAELLPPERRGHFSDDPAIRAAAQGTELYPWADAPEG